MLYKRNQTFNSPLMFIILPVCVYTPIWSLARHEADNAAALANVIASRVHDSMAFMLPQLQCHIVSSDCNTLYSFLNVVHDAATSVGTGSQIRLFFFFLHMP